MLQAYIVQVSVGEETSTCGEDRPEFSLLGGVLSVGNCLLGGSVDGVDFTRFELFSGRHGGSRMRRGGRREGGGRDRAESKRVQREKKV